MLRVCLSRIVGVLTFVRCRYPCWWALCIRGVQDDGVAPVMHVTNPNWEEALLAKSRPALTSEEGRRSTDIFRSKAHNF